MRQILHVPRTIEGLEKAVKRGLRYYHTLCGTVAAMHNLVPVDVSNCGACHVLVERASTTPAEAASSSVDLSDWEQIGAVPESRQPSAVSHQLTPPEMTQIPYEELCTRLGMDPASDPKGRLGNLDVDVRSALTDQERNDAAPILQMVKQLPMGAPLVKAVYRLCHEVAWHRAVSRQPSAVSGTAGKDGDAS